MTRDPPAWLAELQARFGDVIRTPLDRSSGTLTATPRAYDARVVGDVRDAPGVPGAERLAVYNRQYWFRLFEALHGAFPLTARLLGHWSLNDYAARFLLACPPRTWDIDCAADGFEAFFAVALERDGVAERAALTEAARIDAAWRDVFRAPMPPPFRPSAADASNLLDARLTPSPAVAMLEEHYPFLELRKRLLGDPAETRVPLPSPLPSARWWALVRRDEGTLQLPLEEREARLFTLLGAFTVRDALASLERTCSEEERAPLPGKTRAWLARGVELGFWTGIGAGGVNRK